MRRHSRSRSVAMARMMCALATVCVVGLSAADELARPVPPASAASTPAPTSLSATPATPATPVSRTSARSPVQAPAAMPSGIANPWHTLTPRQQTILDPLRQEWNRLGDLNRSKWLKIAERYPKLSQDQQQRLQERMRDWVALTPQQRRVAREHFQIAKQLPAEKKAEAWQNYQQLTDAQKRKLAAASRATKPATAVSALPSSGGIVTDVHPPHHPASQIDFDELLHSE